MVAQARGNLGVVAGIYVIREEDRAALAVVLLVAIKVGDNWKMARVQGRID
jgi:hypothetical protein